MVSFQFYPSPSRGGLGWGWGCATLNLMIKFKKIEHDVEKYFPEATSFLRGDSDISAAYLFGSYAKGRTGPLSDVDLAVLLVEGFPGEQYFDKQLDLQGNLSRILKTDEVDIVILNKANYVLAYEVLKSGKLLFTKDLIQRISFQKNVLDNYLDTQRLRSVNFAKMRKRIKEGTFGQPRAGQ